MGEILIKDKQVVERNIEGISFSWIPGSWRVYARQSCSFVVSVTRIQLALPVRL